MADLIVTQDPTKPGVNKVNGPTVTNGQMALSGLSTSGAVANDVITLSGGNWVPFASSGVETASNVGTGADVFKQKVGANFEFRTLVQGTNITITENANDITITGAASGAITGAFTSTDQVITFGGALVIAHGLSGTPTLMQIRLRNTIAENGYVPPDEVVFAFGSNDSGSGLGISVVPDLTNLNIRYGTSMQVNNKGTGAANGVTPANWVMIIRAWI